MSGFKNRRTAVIITVILCLLALVIGVRRSVGRQAADILEQFEYIGIGQAIVLKMTDDAEGDFPNLENIDTDYVLFWGKEEEG